MNDDLRNSLPGWLPLVVGAVLVVQFAGLGVWQINRGFGKIEARESYEAASGFSNFFSGAEVRPYQPLKASGRFDTDRQFLLDNIILDSRYGYYVLTPLILADDEPVLIVNRGWVQKEGVSPDMAALGDRISVGGGNVTVRGRVGSLPRAGMRMGNAFEGAGGWPLVAVYPTLEDIESRLGQSVQPFVLLMDPDDGAGFLRHWVPAEMGPGRHFAYAFQWFAMGAVLAALLAWHYRRRGAGNE